MDSYANLFDNADDAVVIADAQGNIIFFNSTAQKVFGQNLSLLSTSSEASPLQLFELDRESEVKRITYPLALVIAGERFCDREFVLQSDQGGIQYWLSMTGWPVKTLPLSEKPGGMLIIRDITARKCHDRQQMQTLFRDKLTGLVNRAVLVDRLQHALVRSHNSTAHQTALLCIDVRRIKAINDTFGYAAGDRILVEIANRLGHLLRPGDTLARFGGTEFAILLEDVGSSVEAITLAEAIQSSLAQPMLIEGHEVLTEVNIGISIAQADCLSAETVMRNADVAMHRSKQLFGSQYCVFEEHMTAETDKSLRLEIALKKAIDQKDMVLQYQPIFLIRTQQIIGFESLVRWHHPTEGVLSPSKFIPIAERTGLIIPLGWWILEESCRQLKEWQNTIPQTESLFVSVNMSSKQFSQLDVPQKIDKILKQTGLSPQCLKIEITESVLIDHSVSIIQTLQAIRALGVRLSIDDFGTGYSSLSYLHQFPVDTLKIDRSFLENADADFEKLEILQSVVRLAWNLGLEVVAEGIETPKHFAQIKALRCESGQGFLFSEPLDTQAAAKMLRKQCDQNR